MTDLDPRLAAVLDQFAPASDETGDWRSVIADAAGTIQQPRRRYARNPRLALAVLTLAGLIAALAFVPALAGQGYFWFLDYGAPKPTTAVVTVTSITDRSGTTWQLTAYQSEHHGLCFQLSSASRTGAGACGSPLPIGYMRTSQSESSGAFALGPVTADAQRVEITGSAQTVDAKVAAAPEALRMDVKFYVVQLPPGMADATMTVRALDEHGRVIASFGIPAMARP
jgi:hypothetical protein